MTSAALGAPRWRQIQTPRALLVFGLALTLGSAGLYWIYSAPSEVATDNAYVKADTIAVSSKVRGLVAKVLVQENQTVHAGDALVQLEDDDYNAQVAIAEADLARARASVDLARAALARNQAESALADASIHEADARIHSADAESKRSRRDLDRYAPLSKQGFASQQKFESAAAGSETAGAEAQRARAGFEIARAQALVTLRRADEISAQLADAQAQAARAAANLSLARQDLDHTIIRASLSGTIGDRHVEPGQYVQPGTRLMALVPPSTIYVLANFKETQVAQMRQGQEAVIELDALPGQKFAGTVESLAPASGSEFALLPFEPGTGNFTKIVQRLPVRIKLPPETKLNPALRPGLSANIRVRLSSGT